jgi:Gram-negative bacterial TonB protein C-terminal
MVCMKTICLSLLAATLLLSRPISAQSDAAGLEAALHGKPLGLLTYSADPVVKYTWIDGKLVADPVLLHGMTAFFLDTVRQKGSKVLIEGQSETLVRAGGKLAPMGRVPMRLEVELQGADPAKVFPQLQAALFFPNLQAALDGLPEYVKDMLPFPSDGKFQSICHCTHIHQEGKWVRLDENDPKLTPPAPISAAANPAFNQMAIDAKVSGALTLILYVSERGRVEEVWLGKPLGAGLDEAAAKSSKESTFRPATYDGKPVGVVLLQTVSTN